MPSNSTSQAGQIGNQLVRNQQITLAALKQLGGSIQPAAGAVSGSPVKNIQILSSAAAGKLTTQLGLDMI